MTEAELTTRQRELSDLMGALLLATPYLDGISISMVRDLQIAVQSSIEWIMPDIVADRRSENGAEARAIVKSAVNTLGRTLPIMTNAERALAGQLFDRLKAMCACVEAVC